MTATAVIYARVSDRKQAEENVSVPAQIDLAQKRAIELGATVSRVFTDEGRSAFRESNRKTFEAAVEFAVLTQATYFITWSSSRFARNQFESVLYKRELDRAGVKLVYLSMAIDRDTDEGWLVDGVFGLLDEMQSRQNAKDTKRSMMRIAQQGYWCGGRTPFGYVSEKAIEDTKRRRLVVDPSAAAVVRNVFAARAQGFGSKQIATDLNACGVASRRGASWNKAAVLAMLRNEVYIGAIVFNRTDRRSGKTRPRDQWIVVQSHEPIIDVAIWNQVQEQMNDAADRSEGSPLSRHAFTGLLRCGECGASLQVETARGRSRTYAYYNCRADQTGQGCRTRRLRADVMDEWLTGIILDRVLSRANLRSVATALEESSRARLANQDADRNRLNGELRAMRERNARIYDVLELHGRDAPNLGDLTVRLRENNSRIRELEAELVALDAGYAQRLQVTDRELDLLGDTLRELLEQPDNAARARAFYGSFISRIVVRDRTAEIRYDPARLLSAPAPVHSKVKWLPVGSTLRTGHGAQLLEVDLPLALRAA